MTWLLPITSFGVAVAFWQWFFDASQGPRWMVMAALVPLMLIVQPPIVMTPAHWCGALFLAWSAFSLLWTPIVLDGLLQMWHLILMAGVFCIAAQTKNIKPALLAFCIGVSISGAMAIAQTYGTDLVVQVVSPAGLFLNRNFLAEAAAVALVLAIGYRWWLLVPFLLAGSFLPTSRNVMIALALAGMMWLWNRSRVAVLCLCVIGAGALWNNYNEPRGYGDRAIPERIAIWRDSLDGLQFFGNGLGSFYIKFPINASRIDTAWNRPEYAHDEPIHMAFEMGAPGMGLLAIFLAVAFAGIGQVEKYALVVIASTSLFSFPLHLPATAFIFALLAGHAAANGYRGGRLANLVRKRPLFRVYQPDYAARAHRAIAACRRYFSAGAPDAPGASRQRRELHGVHAAEGSRR